MVMADVIASVIAMGTARIKKAKSEKPMAIGYMARP